MMRWENVLIKLHGYWVCPIPVERLWMKKVGAAIPPLMLCLAQIRTKIPGYDMSFSGLKTAALNVIHNAQQRGEILNIPDLCASFVSAISDMLVPRTMEAVRETGYRKLAVAGGVAANAHIRAAFQTQCQASGTELYIPPLSLCGDNGAMIACQGYYEYLAGHVAGQELNAIASLSPEKGSYERK